MNAFKPVTVRGALRKKGLFPRMRGAFMPLARQIERTTKGQRKAQKIIDERRDAMETVSCQIADGLPHNKEKEKRQACHEDV